MFNQVILLGNLGMNPEEHIFESGNKIAKVSLATSERWKDKATGEKKEKTEWHNLVFYGNQAETIVKYATKGQTLHVTGSVRYRSWEATDGSKRYATDIAVRSFSFVGKAPEGAASAPEGISAAEPDDLPF